MRKLEIADPDIMRIAIARNCVATSDKEEARRGVCRRLSFSSGDWRHLAADLVRAYSQLAFDEEIRAGASPTKWSKWSVSWPGACGSTPGAGLFR